MNPSSGTVVKTFGAGLREQQLDAWVNPPITNKSLYNLTIHSKIFGSPNVPHSSKNKVANLAHFRFLLSGNAALYSSFALGGQWLIVWCKFLGRVLDEITLVNHCLISYSRRLLWCS